MDLDAPHTTSSHDPVPLDADHSPTPALNGVDDDGHESPRSPPTPVSNDLASDMKIDVEFQEQESDARSEPLPPKPNSTAYNHDTHDASAESNGPPNGTTNGINGTHTHDAVMTDADDHTPVATPVADSFTNGTNESLGPSTSHTTPNDSLDDDDDDKPPPAKRARMYSDADKASIAHSATPPPPSTGGSVDTTPVPPAASVNGSQEMTLTVAQYRFCQSTVRSLKKLKDASPFLKPVDPVALNIPHYPQIVKNPMDFSTIERKLNASNPVKPDPNPQNPRYFTADEFITDVRLIMFNCITFNGPDHVITAMGKRVEEVFDKQIKNLPPAEQPKPPPVKKQSTPPVAPPPAPPKKVQPIPRRPSTSVPVIRRNEVPEPVGRPKREIHPPPPKDLSYVDAPKKPRKAKKGKDITSEQLKYCGKILQDLHKKQHYNIASHFYEPVDWQTLGLPTYPKLIKKPMDLSTMRRKLDNNEYPNPQKFYDDFKLMIRNCFTFNPAGTPVNQAGSELQRLFDEKWRGLPTAAPEASDDEDEDDEDDSDEERARTIAMMESQIESMRGTINSLKAKATKEKKKKEKKEKPVSVASTSKVTASKPPKASTSTSSGKKKGKKAQMDDDAMSFEQKKELSEAIAKLDGSKLERVIQIIHEGVPEIRDSTEEIELEIDLLPVPVLMKLYNFVIRPMRPPPPKRNRPGKGTGTGGLKRKSMDEDVEAEKIRQLEQRMALFDQGANGVPPPATARHDSDHSSDSSSDDSSGSDSE